MLNRTLALVVGSLLVAASTAYAQGTLLIEPSQAPITLRGGWEKKPGGAHKANRGDIVVKISKINPDGTFEGKLDFFTTSNVPWCRAADEPIQQGKITANGIRVVASGGPAATCGLMTLDFRRGNEKWLEGKVKSEAGGGSPMWLDAPK